MISPNFKVYKHYLRWSASCQVHLKESFYLSSPNCQSEEQQRRKEKSKENKVTNTEFPPSSPVSFLPGPFWTEIPLQSMRGFSPPFCGSLLYLHQSWDSCALHGKGMPSHLLYNHSRWAWPSHCHVTGCETAVGKRSLTPSLSSPVSPRGTELPNGVWNRYICLNQGSCHHFEMLWPSKDTTYNTDETQP